MLIMCFYPLLMSKFGTVSFAGAYTGILGFFLLGCANLALGVFVSSLTESQVIAAVLTFVFFVCILYDEWNLLILFRGSIVYVYYIWTSDFCSSTYHIHNDQEPSDFRSCVCGRRDHSCSCVYRKFFLFLGRNSEGTEYCQS